MNASRAITLHTNLMHLIICYLVLTISGGTDKYPSSSSEGISTDHCLPLLTCTWLMTFSAAIHVSRALMLFSPDAQYFLPSSDTIHLVM